MRKRVIFIIIIILSCLVSKTSYACNENCDTMERIKYSTNYLLEVFSKHSDEEILAKYLETSENKANTEEKKIIASIIVKDSEEYEEKEKVDFQEALRLNIILFGLYIYDDFDLKEFETNNVEDTSLQIAKEALEEKTHTEYVSYWLVSKSLKIDLSDSENIYRTENYIFFK